MSYLHFILILLELLQGICIFPSENCLLGMEKQSFWRYSDKLCCLNGSYVGLLCEAVSLNNNIWLETYQKFEFQHNLQLKISWNSMYNKIYLKLVPHRSSHINTLPNFKQIIILSFYTINLPNQQLKMSFNIIKHLDKKSENNLWMP